MCVYLRTKFQVSGIILTSFRQGGGGNFTLLPPSKRTPKKTIRNESKTKKILHETLYVYFHIRKHQSPTQKALGNVYNILISNEILGMKSFK